MNPEHVSVEDRRPQTSFPSIPSPQGSLVCPSLIPSKPVSEDSYELQRKHDIIYEPNLTFTQNS
jgi:hypothetical protein